MDITVARARLRGKPSARGAESAEKKKQAAQDRELIAALNSKNLDLALALIQGGANARSKNEEGRTSLEVAIISDDAERVLALLPHFDPKETNDIGDTPLMIAAGLGRARCVKALVPVSDLSAVDIESNTAAEIAIIAGKMECFEAILPAVDPKKPNQRGETLLMRAALDGNAAFTRRLLPLSDAHAVDNVGWTALISAAASGDEECVSMLLPISDARAITQPHKRDALSFALENAIGWIDQAGAARLLIPHSDLDAKDHEGRDALAWAQTLDEPERSQITGLIVAEKERRALLAQLEEAKASASEAGKADSRKDAEEARAAAAEAPEEAPVKTARRI